MNVFDIVGAVIDLADVVISLNGRDEGKRFLVIGKEDEYLLLADGSSRKIEKPKRKKNKHLKLEGKADERIASKLIECDKITNSDVRRAMAQFTANCGEREV